MVTIFASLVGFISSILPEVIKYFKDRSDKKHELDILAKQITFSKYTKTHQIEEVRAYHDILEQKSLYSTYSSGITWVDAINALVRPIIAYSFFILYIWVKYLQYTAIDLNQAPLSFYLDILWNIDDQAIFAGIISFYYGQRTFRKLWKY